MSWHLIGDLVEQLVGAWMWDWWHPAWRVWDPIWWDWVGIPLQSWVWCNHFVHMPVVYLPPWWLSYQPRSRPHQGDAWSGPRTYRLPWFSEGSPKWLFYSWHPSQRLAHPGISRLILQSKPKRVRVSFCFLHWVHLWSYSSPQSGASYPVSTESPESIPAHSFPSPGP